ncbi:MAG: amidohydrolase family protein, partial [Chloroflexi bacterium]|nr:amidohydrolase family protein [Chloroflexota bacterium]
PDPWPGIALAVTRFDPNWGPDVEEPFHPEQAVTLAESVRAACVGPGTSAGDDRCGRLVAGSPADLLVLDRAFLREPVSRQGGLARARPSATLLDGMIVHRTPAWDREPEVRSPKTGAP